MLPLCHKRVHPNPPVSLTISFTWGFLVECRQRLNILPAEIGARLSFLSKLPRESERKKKRYHSYLCDFKFTNPGGAQAVVCSSNEMHNPASHLQGWGKCGRDCRARVLILTVLMTTETSQMHRFAGFILSTCELHKPECIQVSSPRHFQTPHGLLNGAKRCSSPSKSSKVNFVLTVEYNLEISHQFFLCLMMLSY